MPVDSLFKRITLIRYELGEVPFSATAFFYELNGDTFLITNRHVLEHELGVSPENLEIYFRKQDDPKRVQRISLPAKGGDGKPNWFEHPEFPDADITALPLAGLDLDETGNEAFTASDFVSIDDEAVTVGTEAMVTGYPSTGKRPIRDPETSSPVAINALVSSSFGDYFDESPFFLVDAKTYEGMSGSPVLLRPGPELLAHDESIFHRHRDGAGLLGIHSGPHAVSEDLSLNRVWYCELIDEMIEHFWTF